MHLTEHLNFPPDQLWTELERTCPPKLPAGWRLVRAYSGKKLIVRRTDERRDRVILCEFERTSPGTVWLKVVFPLGQEEMRRLIKALELCLPSTRESQADQNLIRNLWGDGYEFNVGLLDAWFKKVQELADMVTLVDYEGRVSWEALTAQRHGPNGELWHRGGFLGNAFEVVAPELEGFEPEAADFRGGFVEAVEWFDVSIVALCRTIDLIEALDKRENLGIFQSQHTH